MAINIQLFGSIQIADSAQGSSPLVKQFANLAVQGSTFTETNQQIIGTSPVSLTLPISPAVFVYIKNLSPSATVTVTWTPNGGSSAVIQTLNSVGTGSPVTSSFMISAGVGVSALSVSASAVNTPIEYILGG